MNDHVFVIFVIGCAVFAVTLGAAFLALIASDHPDESEHVATRRFERPRAGSTR